MNTNSITLNFWTGLMRCGGGEVGGKVTVNVTTEEQKFLDSIKDLSYAEFNQKLHDENTNLWQKIHDEAVEAMEIQMAEEAMDFFDFDDEEFEGWTYEQKLDYVRNSADPDASVDNMCELTYEIA